MPNNTQSIGYIVGGGLKENLRVRLTIPSQQVQEGAFVIIDSSPWRFYGLVTDLQLGATDPRFADEQSETRFPPELARLLHGQTLFTNLEVLPALMREIGPEVDTPEYRTWREAHPEDPPPLPVKTIPPHHAQVGLAQEATSPRSSGGRMREATLSSATPANRGTRCASTWKNSCSARQGCSAPPGRVNPS